MPASESPPRRRPETHVFESPPRRENVGFHELSQAPHWLENVCFGSPPAGGEPGEGLYVGVGGVGGGGHIDLASEHLRALLTPALGWILPHMRQQLGRVLSVRDVHPLMPPILKPE